MQRFFNRVRSSLWVIVALAGLGLMQSSWARAADGQAIVTIYGDSLTAGYQLPPEDAVPAKLSTHLPGVKIINAGISGDTSAGGLARLDWTLAELPDVLVLELGANDALRGLDPARTEANLAAIIEKLQAKGVTVILAGMYAPLNMGKSYGETFNALYPRLAEKYGLALYPFYLDGVVGHPDRLLNDGMHPNAKGTAVIAKGIAPLIKEALNSRAEKPAQ